MRILVAGGAARSLLNFRGALLKALVDRGHEVVACAPDATPVVQRRLKSLGVRYREVPLARTNVSPAGDLVTWMACRRIILKEKPDRVLAYTVKPVIYMHLAARMAGNPPVYGMITGLGYAFGSGAFKQKLIGSVVGALYRAALAGSSGVFFQNPDDRAFFLSKGLLAAKVPAVLINGSGVDLSWYAPKPLPKAPVFLFAGRLLVEKGIREYCQAAYRLKNRYPEAMFQIAGGLDSNPGSIRPDELRQWQAEGVIEHLGVLDDIRPAYEGARVFVLPSYREGTPRTVLEAMAMGRPVITTDAPGCRETVVDGENGFLVPVRDTDSLAKAMERFIIHPETADQMGEKGRRMAVRKYDVNDVNAVIMTVMGIDR